MTPLCWNYSMYMRNHFQWVSNWDDSNILPIGTKIKTKRRVLILHIIIPNAKTFSVSGSTLVWVQWVLHHSWFSTFTIVLVFSKFCWLACGILWDPWLAKWKNCSLSKGTDEKGSKFLTMCMNLVIMGAVGAASKFILNPSFLHKVGVFGANSKICTSSFEILTRPLMRFL